MLLFTLFIASAWCQTYEADFKLLHIVNGVQGRKAIGRMGQMAASWDESIVQTVRESKLTHRISYCKQVGIRAYGQSAFTPNPEDWETVVNFAKISANSYVGRSTMGEWRNLTRWEGLDGFGWDGQGLRGHVFSNDDASILIISFKGTSTIFTGGDTAPMDKYMDNLMFSCCCARVDVSWTPVCGCYLGHHQCNQTCLEETLRSEDESYFYQAKAVVSLVQQRYPRAQLWFTGHSLGGALAALMTVAHSGTAAVTWEAPGAVLYGSRMGLHPRPKISDEITEVGEIGNEVSDNDDDDGWLDKLRRLKPFTSNEYPLYPVWNFGLTSDPIYTGTCKGMGTTCYLSGYAMETKCRHGYDCVFEMPSWRNDVTTHRIDWIIDNVLMDRDAFPLPQCKPVTNCRECERWRFIDPMKDLPPLPIQ